MNKCLYCEAEAVQESPDDLCQKHWQEWFSCEDCFRPIGFWRSVRIYFKLEDPAENVCEKHKKLEAYK